MKKDPFETRDFGRGPGKRRLPQSMLELQNEIQTYVAEEIQKGFEYPITGKLFRGKLIKKIFSKLSDRQQGFTYILRPKIIWKKLKFFIGKLFRKYKSHGEFKKYKYKKTNWNNKTNENENLKIAKEIKKTQKVKTSKYQKTSFSLFGYDLLYFDLLCSSISNFDRSTGSQLIGD